jgi:hypothetical protein
MVKRNHSYIVTVRFPLPDKTTLDRKISENALTPESAVNKVNAWYKNKPHEIISVVVNTGLSL